LHASRAVWPKSRNRKTSSLRPRSTTKKPTMFRGTQRGQARIRSIINGSKTPKTLKSRSNWSIQKSMHSTNTAKNKKLPMLMSRKRQSTSETTIRKLPSKVSKKRCRSQTAIPQKPPISKMKSSRFTPQTTNTTRQSV
jgi:hypothetical protein